MREREQNRDTARQEVEMGGWLGKERERERERDREMERRTVKERKR